MPRVNTEDLIDTNDVQRLLGLSHRETVSQYLHKYPAMPRPVIDLGANRPRLWLRQDIERWIKARGPIRRGRPRGSTTRSDRPGPPGGAGTNRGGHQPAITKASKATNAAERKPAGRNR